MTDHSTAYLGGANLHVSSRENFGRVTPGQTRFRTPIELRAEIHIIASRRWCTSDRSCLGALWQASVVDMVKHRNTVKTPHVPSAKSTKTACGV
eukprot:gene24190-biopygen9888